MVVLLLAVSALLTAQTGRAQDLPYEAYLEQMSVCPKECHCPPSIPSAVYCDGKDLKSIPTIPPHTRYLYLQNNQIENISKEAFSNATQLQWINLNHNKITSEGVKEGALEGLPALLHLYMEDNLMTRVPSPLPPNLEQLRLSRNRISKIPPGVFTKLSHLALLDLHANQLQDDAVMEANLKGLTSLVQINLAKNSLRSMPPRLPTTTTQIFLDSNSIEKIPVGYFNNLPKIAFLRLNRNKLANDGLPKDIFKMSSILDLQLSHNQLTEVPQISANLEQLHLSHNLIKSVNGTSICPGPTDAPDSYTEDQIPRLRYLRLDGNDVQPPIPLDLLICFRLLTAVVI
ncbi:keratocan [Brienomyrus brachyistius]|uniref:keratocan n=1 Tax=Brienomyrus brachyistius TaxID=42636 RepID=UPI0020B37A80|nr:keratocan [Brienomyrus brachyistius]